MEINSLNDIELREKFKELGESPFRGTQLFDFFHRQRGTDIDEITTFSKELRNALKNEEVGRVEILEEYASKLDETKKYLFKLKDGNIIEGVLMKYKYGYSQCISTQVGCKMGCEFCASTKAGLIRNLTPYEMAAQIYEVEKYNGISISNIILMGSGEPLDNFQNVLKFIELIHHPRGKNLSLRNITISTCGIVPKIKELAEKKLPITLSISLHSTNDEDRRRIMPIARRYSLSELMEACRYYESLNNSRTTFEYTLIRGENNGVKNVSEMVELFHGINAHVNLIPLNSIEEFDGKSPSPEEVQNFKKSLENRGINVTVRRELGSDISAACGQLKRSYIEVSD